MGGLFIATSCCAWRSNRPEQFSISRRGLRGKMLRPPGANCAYHTVKPFLQFSAKASREIPDEEAAFGFHLYLGIPSNRGLLRFLHHEGPGRADRSRALGVRLENEGEAANGCSQTVCRAKMTRRCQRTLRLVDIPWESFQLW